MNNGRTVPNANIYEEKRRSHKREYSVKSSQLTSACVFNNENVFGRLVYISFINIVNIGPFNALGGNENENQSRSDVVLWCSWYLPLAIVSSDKPWPSESDHETPPTWNS